MSRHRRQRARRFNRALDKVHRETLERLSYRYDNTGKLPRWTTPIERLAFKRRYGYG